MLTKKSLIIIGVVIAILFIIVVSNQDKNQIENFSRYGYYSPTERRRFNRRFDPRYRDYAYIPQHEYLKRAVNNYRPNVTALVPSYISEYCVNQRLQETGNINKAIQSCVLPPSISESLSS